MELITLPFTQDLMNGQGEPTKITFRRAVSEDIEAVMTLQQHIMDALPDKDLYSPFTREESESQLEHDICFMAECDGEVAGYSVLIPNDPDNPENYGKHFNYDREKLAETCSLDLTMVEPKFRGLGIQRIFNKLRLGIAIDMGAKEALTTISPDNPYSYRNFLVLNFEIVEQREMYGGKQRYILRKYL